MICFFLLSSHVFTILEFDSNHFGILLWKMVKPCDHNEVKPPIEKIFWKYNYYNKYNKVYNNYNKVCYLQRKEKCYDLEITFQKKFFSVS